MAKSLALYYSLPMRLPTFVAAFLIAGLAAGCSKSKPEQRAEERKGPSEERKGPAEERVYVTDEDGGNVVVISTSSDTVVTRIAVGKRPRGLRVSPDGTRLYVALSGLPKAGPGVDES